MKKFFTDLARDIGEALAILAVVVLTAMAIASMTPAHAADKTFTWSNPTVYEDGSPLAPSDLDRYDLGCTSVSGDPYQIIDTFPASLPLPTSHSIDLPPGDYWCVLRVSTPNATSTWSNEVFFTIPFPAPRPIDDLSVD